MAKQYACIEWCDYSRSYVARIESEEYRSGKNIYADHSTCYISSKSETKEEIEARYRELGYEVVATKTAYVHTHGSDEHYASSSVEYWPAKEKPQ